MWKNIVEPGRPQMKIWRMRIACRIAKATNTHSEHVIFIAFPLQQWLHERASFLRYTYIVCLVLSCGASSTYALCVVTHTHTHTHILFGRTSVNGRSDRRKDLYFNNTQQSQDRYIHNVGGIRTCNSSK